MIPDVGKWILNAGLSGLARKERCAHGKGLL
jgi:hypothetical protein